VLARASDAGYAHDMREVHEVIAKLPEKPSVKVASKTDGLSVKVNVVHIVNVTAYRKLCELIAKIQAGASDRLKSKKKEQLHAAQQIQDKLLAVIQVLGSAWDS
jgi:hypothetical protein